MVRVSDAGPEVRLNLFTAKWAEPVRDLLAAGFWTAGLVGRTPEGVIRRESRAVGDSRQETLEAMMDEAEVAFLCRTLGKGVIGKA
jgi:hypothetical protein